MRGVYVRTCILVTPGRLVTAQSAAAAAHGTPDAVSRPGSLRLRVL